jgi:undecaprenyl-diphosphatase
MSLIESIFSGILQGITEFLPVSSSGHLVLLHYFFGVKESNMLFDILLHLATLVAVIIYFSRDIVVVIRNRDVKLILFLMIATVPAVVCGFFLEDFFQSFFNNPSRAGLMFLVTAAFLISADISLRVKNKDLGEMTFFKAVIIGCAQAFALIPGISRSGATISSGLLCGVSREDSFRFSFLLSIPIILGAALYKLVSSDINAVMGGTLIVYISGMLTAFISGIICLRLLWWFLRTSRLYLFAVYCFLLGILSQLFKG